MHTKNPSTFGWLRQRASAVSALLALAVMWTAILVAVRTEARSAQMTASRTSGERALTSERVAPIYSVGRSADLSLDSGSDYRADRAYLHVPARDDVSDYRADRTYFRTLRTEMSLPRSAASRELVAMEAASTAEVAARDLAMVMEEQQRERRDGQAAH